MVETVYANLNPTAIPLSQFLLKYLQKCFAVVKIHKPGKYRPFQ
jgi:hypothetical protein